MIRQLTFEQIAFLQKLLKITDSLQILVRARNGMDGYIDLICKRIIHEGRYDTKNQEDMDKLNAIRNWYIKNYITK